jgi:SnoaL-like protein
MVQAAMTETELAQRLVAAIAAQDATSIARCFAPDAEFRALIPAGLRERRGANDVGALIHFWFKDSTVLELRDQTAEVLGDRLLISYRFTGIEEGKPYIVEQSLACVVSDGLIQHASLLCSGFRPIPS